MSSDLRRTAYRDCRHPVCKGCRTVQTCNREILERRCRSLDNRKACIHLCRKRNLADHPKTRRMNRAYARSLDNRSLRSHFDTTAMCRFQPDPVVLASARTGTCDAQYCRISGTSAFVTLIGEVTKTPQLHNPSEIVNMYSWSAVNATNLPICGKTFPLCRIFLPHLVTKLLMFAICSPCKISVVPAQD